MTTRAEARGQRAPRGRGAWRGAAALALGLTAAAASLPASAQGAGAIALPSGRSVSFHDAIWGERGPAGLTLRFRFIEPGLAAAVEALDYEAQEADMRFLCESYALGRIASTGPQPNQVVISISDRPVAFGTPDPGARQVFEAYRPEAGACIWEGF